MPGKPIDPDYWRKWRAAHPEYQARERQRSSHRDRSRRNYAHENRNRPSRAVEPVPLLHPHAQNGVRLAFWEDELRLDLVQERILAKLEGRDPDEAAKEYRAREVAWRNLTRPLLHGD